MSPRLLFVLLWPVVTSVTTATAVAGGADRSDSPPSLPLYIMIRDHREAQCLFQIPTISFFGTLFDKSIPNKNFDELNTIVN